MRRQLIQKQVRRPRQQSQEGWFRNNLQWLQLQQLHETAQSSFFSEMLGFIIFLWYHEIQKLKSLIINLQQ
jgi:hypothetical protein